MPREITCLLLDRNDGECYLKTDFLSESVPCALTPEAASPLIEKGVLYTEPTASALAWANARATVRARKLSLWVQTAVAKPAILSPAGVFALDRTLRRSCVAGQRIWSILGGFSGFAYRSDERWIMTNERLEVYGSLMKRIGWRIPNYKFLPDERRVSWAYTALSHLLAIRGGLRGAIFYCMIRKHFGALASEVEKADPKITQFGAERVFNAHWNDAVNYFRYIRETSGRKIERFIPGLNRGVYRKAESEAFRVLDEIDDPLLKLAVEPQRQAIATEVAVSEGYASWFSKMFYWHRPRAVLLNSMSTGLNIALSQAARKCKVPVYLVSHCSVGEGPLAYPLHREALQFRNVDLCASPFAEIQIVQSPHAEAASETLAPSAKRMRVRPVIWGGTIVKSRPEEKGEEFTILHAGNFQAWEYYEPFSSECSLEYVRGIVELAKGVIQIPHCKLVIRMKPGNEHKTECLLEGVRRRLPAKLNHRFSVEGSFYEELKAADLLISSTSTVIEESLLSHIPVLLHSGGRIKPIFPARMLPPTATERAAVYALESPGCLVEMLEAIVAAHFKKPLTDQEISRHCFDETILSRSEFAHYLSQGNLDESLASRGSRAIPRALKDRRNEKVDSPATCRNG